MKGVPRECSLRAGTAETRHPKRRRSRSIRVAPECRIHDQLLQKTIHHESNKALSRRGNSSPVRLGFSSVYPLVKWPAVGNLHAREPMPAQSEKPRPLWHFQHCHDTFPVLRQDRRRWGDSILASSSSVPRLFVPAFTARSAAHAAECPSTTTRPAPRTRPVPRPSPSFQGSSRKGRRGRW